MIVIPRHRAVFISQSRCCTGTMFEVLKADYDGRRIGRHAHENNIPWQFRHWFTFAIVRNPYDRVVSLWRRLRPQMDFIDFCRWLLNESVSPLPQAEWLAPVSLTMTLPFERFPECLAWLPFWKGGGVPHRHKTKHLPFIEYMVPTAREAIKAWAHADFDKFGYSHDPSAAT